MKAITILDVAIARGIRESETGGYTLGAFDDVGLPFMGGCQRCEACIAAYNAAPSITGYIMCADGCIGKDGFPSVKAFEAWSAYRDALAESEAIESDDDSTARCVSCGEVDQWCACMNGPTYKEGCDPRL